MNPLAEVDELKTKLMHDSREAPHRCESCGEVAATLGTIRWTPNGTAVSGCSACIRSWGEFLSVAWEHWLASRASTAAASPNPAPGPRP